ncbi:lipinN-terminal conserved region family protein [Aphelenchoides avenae]|nr:lipinN-terminal conserved region family protein [Aphelenchus avenae]
MEEVDSPIHVTTKFQGTAWCSCHIYLWHWTDRLVISDVDGTITKSDVLGHVIPAIGGTWAHTGVVELYNKISNNGEVIEKRPDEFKIECLSRLKSMFPSPTPFYAGFGNRETDSKAYTAVNIRKDRILLINPAGHLRSASTRGYISSYSSIAMDAVDYLFPPRRNCMLRMSSTTDSMDEECSVADDSESPQHLSSFAYWHTSPLDFDFNLQDSIATYESRRRQLKA